MMQVNKKYVLWILVFVAASLITVLFLGLDGISVGNIPFAIASLLFYAVPIAMVVYVISLVKRYVDCKVMESGMGCRCGCKYRTVEAADRTDRGQGGRNC
jgi:hypothetical protein